MQKSLTTKHESGYTNPIVYTYAETGSVSISNTEMSSWFTSADTTECAIDLLGFTITKEASDTYDVVT